MDAKTYELKIRILGNEVFAIGLSTTDTSNRWMAIGMISVFSLVTILGAYGEKIVNLYNHLVK